MREAKDSQAAPRICYRCGKAEQAGEALRLLPGSTQITLCAECYQIMWGWHERPAAPPTGAGPAGKTGPGAQD